MDVEKLISQARDRIAAHKGTGIYRRLADSEPELSYSWVRNFSQGLMGNPSARKLAALDRALKRIRK